MSYGIKVSKLMKRLIEAEDVTEKYKDPLHFLEKQPENIKYLYTKFVLPITRDNSVSISGLDMTQFERDDLETLWELYQNEIGPESPNWSSLRQIYITCVGTKPECHTVSFI